MNISEDIFNMNLRVTYYARVSTDNESQNSSIINQEDYFYNYINGIDNWIYIPGYVDYGISGKEVTKRGNFLKMIDDAVNDKFDFILTKSVSRFARNTIDSIKYTDLLKSKGIGVYFINDNINTFSGDSEFRLTLMASIAQDEIRKLSESVRFGLRESIRRGIVLGSNNILGYDKYNGRLSINEKEAIIVRDVFNLFINNKYSYRKLALIINKKYNRKLDSSAVKRILTNCKYKGYYCGRKSMVINYKTGKRVNFDKKDWITYKDYESIPPIVSDKMWNVANEIIDNKRKNKGKYSVMCGNHNKEYKYVVKRYKSNIYRYYYCKECSSVREDFLERMCNLYKVRNVYVYNCADFKKIIINIYK